MVLQLDGVVCVETAGAISCTLHWIYMGIYISSKDNFHVTKIPLMIRYSKYLFYWKVCAFLKIIIRVARPMFRAFHLSISSILKREQHCNQSPCWKDKYRNTDQNTHVLLVLDNLYALTAVLHTWKL